MVGEIKRNVEAIRALIETYNVQYDQLKEVLTKGIS
jgi:hypothetical protein